MDKRSRDAVVALSFAATMAAFPSGAVAQIDRPGAHPDYTVELEPHGLIQWDVEPWDDEGFGLGFRASMPVFHNGPVTTINNSMAIGFGLDWAYTDDCYWWRAPREYRGECDVHNLSFPVVLQWNFFFTPVISAFAELGLAVVYATWDYPGDWLLPGEPDEDDIDVDPVFLIGPRFIIGDNFAIPIKIGWPYLSVGFSILA
jgi:hypothetical protein